MIIAGTISAAIAALLIWLIWTIGAKSQQPRLRENNVLPEGAYETITFENGGSVLQGWLLHPAVYSVTDNLERNDPAEKPAKQPLVIVAHGWGSNRSRVLRYTKPLLEAGFTVFMYDARSHGDSDPIKAPSALMFRADIEAAVAVVRTLPDIDSNRIAVLGHSLGGFGTVLAIGRGLPVRAVVTDSMPIRFETMLKAELKRKNIPFFPLGYLIPAIWLLRAGISRDEYKEAQIPLVLTANEEGRQVPMLMIHAKEDPYIPCGDLRELALQGRVDALFVEGNGHSQSEQDPAFWGRVIPFLTEKLAKAQA
ncbi:alpha/beta hydrolase [Paenibacillus solisilvae]|uniref:Alpha/beta hydrolase n=1 Tax=Paenibacillus solisilvae TaxID=2486751 RepID=A0ABW0W169_9BACL